MCPAIAFSKKPVQVLIYGTGTTARQHAKRREIDGDHNGTVRGHAVAIIARTGVTIGARVPARVAAGKPKAGRRSMTQCSRTATRLPFDIGSARCGRITIARYESAFIASS
jgi:hypothetical protein